MDVQNTRAISLISRWFIKPGGQDAATVALETLADAVQRSEPDTLTYLVHTPYHRDGLQSLPPADPLSVLFFEVYRNAEAFLHHVNGPLFTDFVTQHGGLFVAANGKPFTFVEFLTLRAGFNRMQEDVAVGEADNRHPSVMFEIMAKQQPAMMEFYHAVFGWRYQAGKDGFAYVHFASHAPPLLGGIGQADASIPGLQPGHSFYILVDNLETTLKDALAAGGKPYMPPASVDGYRFAMFQDPEGNPIGLVEPFKG